MALGYSGAIGIASTRLYRVGESMISNDNSEAVAEFIRTKGITRCPTACVLPTQGLVGAADRVALEQHAVARDRVRRARGANSWGNLAKPQR